MSGRDSTEFLFPFRMVDTRYVGQPEEASESEIMAVKIDVSRTLDACWDFDDQDLIKVMFEFGKRHVIEKLKDGTLINREELVLHTANADRPCIFDPSVIEEPSGAVVTVDPREHTIMENETLLQIGGGIIDTRDNINAVFDQSHGEKLLLLGEERDLLQFFRPVTMPEEFFYRVCALANVATRLNVEKLRILTGNNNSEDKSVTLLEQYLAQEKIEAPDLIAVLRAINKLRQGYPVHGDRSRGVLEAHDFFGLDYPVSDHEAAWLTLISRYRDSLTGLLEALKA